MIENIMTILYRGGIMMIPLGICSFIVVLITIERILLLRGNRLVARVYYDEWRNWFASKTASDFQDGPAQEISILGRILSPLSTSLPLSQNRLEERIGDLSRLQKHKLERGLVFLETIAGIAPLFGLLGTALGMVEVFSRLSLLGEAKMSALSSGISQALFTTVAGLFIGIPALIAYKLLSRHIDNLMFKVEEQLNLLLDEFYHKIIIK